MPPIDPNIPGGFGGGPDQPAQPVQSLLQMLSGGVPQGGGGDPYGGKTLAQILEGGNPYGQTWQSGGRVGGPDDGSFANWENQPATNQNVSDAIQRGGQYRPDFAKSQLSSGPEGGFFSIPGMTAGTEIPWGYYPNPNDPGAASGDPTAKNPAPGLIGMSTNNWRLLPKQFQNPNYAMRAGHIIDRSLAANLGGYLGYAPMGESLNRQTHNLGAGGHGYPVSYGYPFGPRRSFFPGQLEPGIPEGGPGGMGTGVT